VTVPTIATLGQLSNNLMYSAMAVYGLAMLVYAAEVAVRARRPDRVAAPAMAGGPGPTAVICGAGDAPVLTRLQRLGRVGVSLTILAVGLHLAAVLARGLAAGRVPWGNMYEFATAGALAASGAFLVLLRRQPVRDLGVWVIAVVLLTLGLSVTVLYTPAGDLVPALNSYWLFIHVIAAVVSGGIFTVGGTAAVLYLLRLRADRRSLDGRAGGYAASLPTAGTLDRVTHIAHLFAFPIWTFAVIAGAIWAENSWGRYWGWDPKETWAFITWVFYAAYLHAQATAGWRGGRATWFALAGYVAYVFNFFGVNMWITGLHSYAGI
jgi:cytochrome c-type biogenesis protein CcsB